MTTTFLKNTGSSGEAANLLNTIQWEALPLRNKGSSIDKSWASLTFGWVAFVLEKHLNTKLLLTATSHPQGFEGLLLYSQHIWMTNCSCQISKDTSTTSCSKSTSTLNLKIPMENTSNKLFEGIQTFKNKFS